jgi:hypothetical protein
MSPLESVTGLFNPVEFNAGLKAHFGIKHSPMESLSLGDDDWALVIKMHGFVELALNDIVSAHFNDPRLDKVIRKLESAHDGRGKIAFIRALDLLPERACNFIGNLAKLRAMVVHDIRHLDLRLVEYVAKLPATEQDNWRRSVAWWLKSLVPLDSFLESPGEYFIISTQILMSEAWGAKFLAREKARLAQKELSSENEPEAPQGPSPNQ